MITPADMLEEVVHDVDDQEFSAAMPMSTQTYDYRGMPQDSDMD